MSGWPTYFVFVDEDYRADYRIKKVLDAGAIQLNPRAINWYWHSVRNSLGNGLVRKITDRLVAYSAGLYALKSQRIDVLATEWTGGFGRCAAEVFLRPAKLLKVPVFSLPHGYFLWRNSVFNSTVEACLEKTGSFPDFSDRNWFYRYVVQSPEHKQENIKYGMNPDKIVVLGSARFCPEWSQINQSAIAQKNKYDGLNTRVVLFFLPHWSYQVHREKCLSLLEKIASEPGLVLQVKAHTRGTGALREEEKNQLRVRGIVEFPGESDHSVKLIQGAGIIVNFGSSIAFDALILGKPVVNPRYLYKNRTFFD